MCRYSQFSVTFHFSIISKLYRNFFRKLFGNLYTLLIIKYSFAGEPDIQEIANVGGGGDVSFLGGGGGLSLIHI